MNREDAREYAEIMMAYANGADVEIYNGGEWVSIIDPDFLFNQNKYRIKPEPKKRLMTREEAIYLSTTTLGMVILFLNDDSPMMRPAQFVEWNSSQVANMDYARWAIINKSGEPVDGWNTFEVEVEE